VPGRGKGVFNRGIHEKRNREVSRTLSFDDGVGGITHETTSQREGAKPKG